MPTLSMNQFTIQPVAGDVTNAGSGMTLSAQIYGSESSPAVAAQAMKLVATSSAAGVPVITALTSVNDAAYCVIIRSLKNATFPAGSPVEIAMRNSIIWMTASEAINAGVFVEVNYATGKVRNCTGTHPSIGIAQNKVTADGDLIRVLLDVPQNESPSA